MARNDGVNRTVARNRDLKTSSNIQGAEAHNERKKDSYSNPDIVPERTPFNVHFKVPTGSYEDMFAELEQQKVISTWGQKPDSTKFCELVFDVNSAYFFNHGGYEFAKQFYADAYEAAVKIVGGEQFILSAVMHADERNRAMSEALGQDVYHYHMHVVYIPVVEKQILWSKRCKDESLRGTVKETIMQVSRSKKWESKQAVDENGAPMVTSTGKKILRKSYSVLQDDFYEHMVAAGYTDIQRGERGSTEEHLTVTQFKVEQEQQRLEAVTAAKLEAMDALDQLSMEELLKKDDLEQIDKQTAAAQKRLDELVPTVKGAEDFVSRHVDFLEDLLPEAGPLERAKTYREEKALPLIRKLKKTLRSLYRTVIDLRKKLDNLQRTLRSAARDRDYYKKRFEEEQVKSGELQEAAEDLSRVKRALGPDRIDAVISIERDRDAAIEAEQQRLRSRKRHERDAR